MIKVDLQCPTHGMLPNIRVRTTERQTVDGDKYNSYFPCPTCGTLARKLPSCCGIPKISDTNPIPLPGVGRFTSSRKMEQWAQANGQDLVVPGSRRHKELHEFAEGAAHQTAVDAGYRDEDHYHATVDDKKYDKAREAAEKQRIKAQVAQDHNVVIGGETVFDASGYKTALVNKGLE